MSVFANVIVIDSLVTESGGSFAVKGETLDFDPDGNGTFSSLSGGEPVAFEDGTTVNEVDGSAFNLGFATATITYEDGSTQTLNNLLVQTLENGQTIVYASNSFPTGLTPTSNLSPTSIVINSFSYSFNGYGSVSDTTFVDLGDGDSAPCFAEGTLIRTDRGDVAVEMLMPGDSVITLDHGAQTICWIGRRRLSAADLARRPDLRPIRIKAGTLGARRDLVVSPNHRMLVSDWRVAAMTGEAEALVAARDLVNDATIRQVDAPLGVVYHHVLLERHEIIFAEGTQTESLHPDIGALDARTRDEILHLFPELEGQTATPARPVAPALMPKALH